MKTNKMGISVKRNINNFLNTLFGIITNIEHALLKQHKEVKITENACIDRQTERTLLEADVKKSQAIEFIRKLQNR